MRASSAEIEPWDAASPDTAIAPPRVTAARAADRLPRRRGDWRPAAMHDADRRRAQEDQGTAGATGATPLSTAIAAPATATARCNHPRTLPVGYATSRTTSGPT